MGFFRKEQKVKFIRDEEGRVIRTEKRGDRMGESRTPVSDALLRQQQHKAVEKSKPGFWKGAAKRVDKAIVNYNRSSNPWGPRSRSPGPIESMFSPAGPPRKQSGRSKKQYVVIDGIAYPKAKKKRKGKKKKGSNRADILDFDPFKDNWFKGF